MQQKGEEQKQQPNEQSINLPLLQQFDADEPEELVVHKSTTKHNIKNMSTW